MGAKNWILVYSDGNPRETLARKPALDRKRSEDLARRLFPGAPLCRTADTDLTAGDPRDGDILVGCYDDVSIVAAEEFGIDYPSKLDPHFLKEGSARTVHLHAMHSVVDWAAFAVWRNGKVIRSLSLSPDSGVLEDIGARLEFERPYWDGQHPATEPDEEPDAYPFPFHPLEIAEAALKEFFGYQLEGLITPDMLEPQEIPLMCFRRSSEQSSTLQKSGHSISWTTRVLNALLGRKPRT